MTTLAELALQVAQEVTDVTQGIATGGSATTLADSVLLARKPDDYYKEGRLWIKSLVFAGRTYRISASTQAGGVVTMPSALASAILVDTRYAVARSAFPWDQIVAAIQRALDSTWITVKTSAVLGDGTTLEFVLPAGVRDVLRVEYANGGKAEHWQEIVNGTLRFETGFAPASGAFPIYYRGQHPILVLDTDTISGEIDPVWLKYKAAQELLWWGVSIYGSQVEYRIEERMNKVMAGLKNKSPHDMPFVRVRVAG
jgi:hypothetical protein